MSKDKPEASTRTRTVLTVFWLFMIRFLHFPLQLSYVSGTVCALVFLHS